MKRNKLIKHINAHGCFLDREGSNHSVFVNHETLKTSAIPRHNEIKDTMCNVICKQLGIPKIKQ